MSKHKEEIAAGSSGMGTAPPTIRFEKLDLLQLPLKGLNLIEASAGTGKTWTITALYARLILEENLKAEEILAVTYTKAATAELRGRIRARLAGLLEAFKSAAPENGAQPNLLDPFSEAIVDRCRSPKAREAAIRRLSHAVLGFDEAAVYTIHGFCQRVLNDCAFESGVEFECELLPDETELLQEIVDDFWRREVAPEEGLWTAYLAGKQESPDGWLGEILPHAGKPFLTILPAAAPDKAADESLEQRFKGAFAHCRSLWRRARLEIEALLLESDALNGAKYNKKSFPEWFAALDDYFAAAKPALDLPEKFGKFTASELRAGCNRGKTAPAHSFFDACESLLQAAEKLSAALEERLVSTKVRLLHECNAELPRRKQRLKRLSYPDLLNRLAQALESAQGEPLAKTLRARYRAALIDEFQDTDPVQYAIFSRIYGGGELPLFFVGDPKQAIYAFRGADIHSYLKAHKAAQGRYTLTTNQRSTPELIAAVNAIFQRGAHPFLFKAIGYHEVEAAQKERPLLVVEGDDPEPFRFMMLPRADDGKPLNKGSAGAFAVEAAAGEIVRLLNLAEAGKARLQGKEDKSAGEPIYSPHPWGSPSGLCCACSNPLPADLCTAESRPKGVRHRNVPHDSRPVNGGDIAVLTYTHHQARSIQEALSRRNVPSVRQGQDNLFESAEAGEMERILGAIAEPGREGLVKAALVTEIMGFSADAVAAMQIEEDAWERQIETFQRYRELWLERGFIVMLRRWFADRRVAARLLAYRDGERRLTNLLHLAERLQVESRDKPGCEPLLGWLSRAIRNPRGDDEEALLRLESDAERVKIVTIHTSKGLEYPIVFCPFLWDGALWKKGESGAGFHDPDHENQACLDFGTEDFDRHKALAGIEKLAEKLRLVYVALTRAKHRCYVVWGDVRSRGEGIESAALSWLLHAPEENLDDPLGALKRHIQSLSADDIRADIAALAEAAPQAIRMNEIENGGGIYLPNRPEEQELKALSFGRGALRPNWRMTSFTGMTAGRHSEAPDYDAVDRPEMEEAPGGTIFTFPRGTLPGTCLHAIFEEWPFDCSDREALRKLAARKLKTFGIADTWTEVVASAVRATLEAPLNPEGLRLCGLGERQKLTEMEFTYPLSGLSAAALRSLLEQPGHGVDPAFAAACGQLGFDRIEGFMKGFIDLIFKADGRFYLVDYKSNWLGGRAEHYGSERLKQAVAQNHYYLQYLIYCLALNRYLASRLPDYDYERHFGGVYYLFLRGIDPASPGAGIYYDRPGSSLLRALESLIAGNKAHP